MTLEETYRLWQSMQPLSNSQQHKLSMRFTVEYNYNSNHMEGNTLTYGQTELLLLFGKVSGDGHLKDFADMKASEVSVKMMTEEAKEQQPLTQNFIRTLHKTLLREDYTVYRMLPGGVQTSYVIHAGCYKTRPNSVITRYGDRFEYASPEETPALMADLVDWYNAEEKKGKMTPVELAALFHYRYIRIHPFEDGNGRIARLLVNYILARHGWPMIVVRSRKKQDYLEALHQSDLVVGPAPSDGAKASLVQIRHFLKYFKNMVKTEVEADINFLKTEGEPEWWYDGEPIKFRTPNGYKVLNTLSLEYDISVSELARVVGINKSAAQKLVNSMLEKGYIQRNEKDGYWHVVAISTE
ncbi:MAG: Fic family protein [Bacteroidales bacterium]|nr:Fic family protein [Bacteroidales bacterium]